MMLDDDDIEELKTRLALLRQEHRDLDAAIASLHEGTYVNELQITRLKKRKLQLKDTISKIETRLIPDLNA
ncbi:MAG: hypothetical protein C0631_08840 [Sedimenticola sp.]|jgi:hypothetical protein|nr:MAG: hypothetical protein C0631_08840 [Sedimenticola sp.]